MIVGAHSIIYSRKPEADRAFLRDVLDLTHVDAGDGWLIFGLPPAELAVHPSAENDVHEFFLMCDDVRSFVARMRKRGIRCTRVQEQSWGALARVTLPGGGKLGIYQPRHPRPKPVAVPSTAKSAGTARRKAAPRAAATPRRRVDGKRPRHV